LAGAAARQAGPVDAGPLNKYAQYGVTDRWAASDGFFVVSRCGKLYAVSSHCTHKRVQLVIAKGERDGGFKCPRHGSTFDPAGHVTKAPARKALPRFGIRVNDAGHIIVDPSVQFGEKDWNNPACSVSTAEAKVR